MKVVRRYEIRNYDGEEESALITPNEIEAAWIYINVERFWDSFESLTREQRDALLMQKVKGPGNAD